MTAPRLMHHRPGDRNVVTSGPSPLANASVEASSRKGHLNQKSGPGLVSSLCLATECSHCTFYNPVSLEHSCEPPTESRKRRMIALLRLLIACWVTPIS